MANIVIQTNVADVIKRLRDLQYSMADITSIISNGYAREYASTLRKHFTNLDARKSKYGRRFYLSEGRNRVQVVQHGEEAHVTVEHSLLHHPMAHKLWGGIQRARRVGHLSLPISEEAKEAGSAKNFSQPLVAVKSKRGNTILIAKRGKKDFTVHYLLKEQVTHKPHPEVLLDANETAQVLDRARANILKSIEATSGGLIKAKT